MAHELYEQAVRCHQTGKLAQAEALYAQVIQIDPAHAGAHQMLGLLAHQAGRHDAAADLLKRACMLAPSDWACHMNLGIVHMSRGRAAEAAACFQDALSLAPAHAEGHFNLGHALAAQKKVAEAAASYRQALALNPNHLPALYNLAVCLRELGQRDEAGACYRRILEREPNNVKARFALGNILKEQGNSAEAARCYEKVLAAEPEHADAHITLGNILKEQGRINEALACYRQALQIRPEHADALNNLGAGLHQQGLRDEAAQCFARAVRANPRHAAAFVNLGNCLNEADDPAQAVACYAEALRLEPRNLDALHNMGVALDDQGRSEEAVSCFRKALEINPHLADAHHNLSCALWRLAFFQDMPARSDLLDEYRYHCAEALRLDPAHAGARWHQACEHLQNGDFELGWPDYEMRWALPRIGPRSFTQPRWDGASFAGKTILVYAEGGLGDSIQFVRYLPFVKARGGTVLFECQAAVASLCARVAGVDRVLTSGEKLPRFDAQVPLLSLPCIFQTSLETIPASGPYVRADAAMVEKWRRELSSRATLRIGIAWQGSPRNAADRDRSLPLKHFEVVSAPERVSLLSLQVGPGRDQLSSATFPVTDLGGSFDPNSLEDLAAVLTQLDLVITVESAVAHLAGALGVPAWVLLNAYPNWRWLLDRADSPWYPSLRLFRQTRLGDWDGVFARIADAFKAWAPPVSKTPSAK